MAQQRPHRSAVEEPIAAKILADCAQRQLRPGERIGSERQLATQYGIPRSQLRRALDDLEDAGLVRRGMGRGGGVFFDDGHIQRHLNTTQGVPEMVRRQGMTLRTEVLAAETASVQPAEQRNLDLPESANVFRLERLRSVEGIPWSLDTSSLPAARFPGLLGQDLAQSLYATLARDYHCDIDHADETIEVVPASERQAKLLQVAPHAPLLLIWRTAYDTTGTAVEFAHDYFRADRTRVHMHKYGANWKRAVERSGHHQERSPQSAR